MLIVVDRALSQKLVASVFALDRLHLSTCFPHKCCNSNRKRQEQSQHLSKKFFTQRALARDVKRVARVPIQSVQRTDDSINNMRARLSRASDVAQRQRMRYAADAHVMRHASMTRADKFTRSRSPALATSISHERKGACCARAEFCCARARICVRVQRVVSKRQNAEKHWVFCGLW